jgi:hypothetical protein
MREIRQSGSEGGAAELIGLPYPYQNSVQSQKRGCLEQAWASPAWGACCVLLVR